MFPSHAGAGVATAPARARVPLVSYAPHQEASGLGVPCVPHASAPHRPSVLPTRAPRARALKCRSRVMAISLDLLFALRVGRPKPTKVRGRKLWATLLTKVVCFLACAAAAPAPKCHHNTIKTHWNPHRLVGCAPRPAHNRAAPKAAPRRAPCGCNRAGVHTGRRQPCVCSGLFQGSFHAWIIMATFSFARSCLLFIYRVCRSLESKHSSRMADRCVRFAGAEALTWMLALCCVFTRVHCVGSGQGVGRAHPVLAVHHTYARAKRAC